MKKLLQGILCPIIIKEILNQLEQSNGFITNAIQNYFLFFSIQYNILTITLASSRIFKCSSTGRGYQIAQSNKSQVNCVESNFYTVKSQSGNGEYTVNKVNGEWVCTCPDNTYRHVKCKHIHSVIFSQTD